MCRLTHYEAIVVSRRVLRSWLFKTSELRSIRVRVSSEVNVRRRVHVRNYVIIDIVIK
jgi:hypothetical protein